MRPYATRATIVCEVLIAKPRIYPHIHIQNAPMAERLLAQNHLSVHKRLKKVAAIEDQRAQVQHTSACVSMRQYSGIPDVLLKKVAAVRTSARK